MSEALKVLLLEDNRDDALLVRHELKRAGFEVEAVRVDTRVAYEAELKKEPDLILADFTLPQYDALSALRLLKETGLDIPFIIVSGAISEEFAIKCLEEGANDYLLKDRMLRLGPAVRQALVEHRLRKDKRSAEQALSESEKKYRSLFMESREGIITTDLTGTITETNPAFEELIGYERKEIIGRPLFEFFVNPKFRRYLTEMREAYGFARNIEIDFLHKDQHVLHVLVTGSVMKDEKGEPQSFLGILRDITERKRSQREMEVIIAVNAALRTAETSKEMVPVVAKLVQDIVNPEGVAIFLKDPITDRIQLETLTGEWADFSDFSIQLDSVMQAAMLESGTVRHWKAPFDAPELKVSLTPPDLKRLFCIPMTTDHGKVGLIWYGCKDDCVVDSFSLVQVIANISANAIHRTMLHENNLRSLQESEALANISSILNQNLNLETIFRQIVREAVGIIPEAYRSVIHLYDEKTERLHAVALSWYSEDRIETRSLIEIRVSPKNEFDFDVLDEEDIQAASMRVGKGVAGKVIESGQPIIVHDTQDDARYLQIDPGPSIRSILVAPILSGDKRLGTLSVLAAKANEFTQIDQNLVERMCTQASIAIENARLLEAERRQRHLAQAQAELSSLLNESLALDEVLAGVLNHTIRFFNASAANIMLVLENKLNVVRHMGYRGAEELMDTMSVSLEDLEESYEALYRAYFNTEVVVLQYKTEHTTELGRERFGWVRSHISIPLVSNNQVIGILNMESDRLGSFEELEPVQLESFSNSAAVALENARLYADLEQSLATEKATRSQLIQADKLAGMGRMVASVAHELNNPLQTIKNCLFLIEQSFADPEDVDLLDLAMSEVQRLTSIVNRLRDVYRPVHNNEYVVTALGPLMLELEKLLETHLRRNRVDLKMDVAAAKGVSVQVFPDQLKQVFLNLSLNAIEAMQPDGGDLGVSITKNNKMVHISFSDTGSGIHQDDLAIIFDPFYTTKESGMGLGLSICYDIVHNHNGAIKVKNNPEKGVTFTVSLPLN